MKRAMAALLILALAGVGGLLAFQAAEHERQYREHLSRGDAALRQGETFVAIEAYSGAIALRPDSMLAHLRRGEIYRQRNEFDAAARDFRDASLLDPSSLRPLEARGDMEYHRQWYERAAEVYEARLKIDDRSPLVTYKLALSRYRTGNLEGALAAIAQTLALNEQFVDAHYLKGICLREQGQKNRAVEAFEKVIAFSPTSIPAREELADLYREMGRPGNQLEQLQLIAGLDRTRVERLVAVSMAHARAGRGELAVLTLGDALERTPDAPMVYTALGRVWLDMAETRDDALSKALEALERVAASATASSEALTLYGRALIRTDQLEAAERILQQATRRFPVDLDAFVPYADVAERHGHYESARSALTEYLALAPDRQGYASRAGRIGRLSLRLNQPAAAVTWLQRAVNASPADASLLGQLADAQLQSGDRAAALATIKTALETSPEDPALLALRRRAR
jgi:tetratricopeptide (TPR) repeat protein